MTAIKPIYIKAGNDRAFIDALCVATAQVVNAGTVKGHEYELISYVQAQIEHCFIKFQEEGVKQAAQLDKGIDRFNGFATPIEDTIVRFPENTFERLVEQAEERADWDKDETADLVDAGKTDLSNGIVRDQDLDDIEHLANGSRIDAEASEDSDPE
jgi:hypothetical protein